jgi:hypothetical protein
MAQNRHGTPRGASRFGRGQRVTTLSLNISRSSVSDSRGGPTRARSGTNGGGEAFCLHALPDSADSQPSMPAVSRGSRAHAHGPTLARLSDDPGRLHRTPIPPAHAAVEHALPGEPVSRCQPKSARHHRRLDGLDESGGVVGAGAERPATSAA